MRPYHHHIINNTAIATVALRMVRLVFPNFKSNVASEAYGESRENPTQRPKKNPNQFLEFGFGISNQNKNTRHLLVRGADDRCRCGLADGRTDYNSYVFCFLAIIFHLLCHISLVIVIACRRALTDTTH